MIRQSILPEWVRTTRARFASLKEKLFLRAQVVRMKGSATGLVHTCLLLGLIGIELRALVNKGGHGLDYQVLLTLQNGVEVGAGGCVVEAVDG